MKVNDIPGTKSKSIHSERKTLNNNQLNIFPDNTKIPKFNKPRASSLDVKDINNKQT